MKKLLCVFLTLILLLGGCGPKNVEPPEEELGYPAPQGLFAYRNPETYGLMGLVNAQGELVIPCMYDSINVVGNYDYSEPSPSLAAEDRFFIAGQYPILPEDWSKNPSTALGPEEPMPDDFEAEEPYDPYAHMERQALISPEGKLLTEFDYFSIAAIPGDVSRFVAQSAADPARFVFLDREGRESELDDPNILAIMVERTRWMQGEPLRLEGPDIPRRGLEGVFFLPDGSFWGGHSKVLEAGREPQGKGDYELTYLCYSPEGIVQNGYEYNYVENLGHGVLRAQITHIDEAAGIYTSETYLTDLWGRPLTDAYTSIETYNMGPYATAYKGDITVLYLLEEGQATEVDRFTLSPETYAQSLRLGEEFYFIFTGSGVLPEIKNIQSGDSLILEAFPGYSVDACNDQLTRFILSSYGPGKGDYRTILADLEGNILLEGYETLYGALGAVVAANYDDATEQYTMLLLDWDGQVLIGEGCSHLEVLPGNGALVVREDGVGLMDFGGNWIYKDPAEAEEAVG